MEPRLFWSIRICHESTDRHHPAGDRDTRSREIRVRAYTWTDIATPDVSAIDAHIQRADFVLVTHAHYDHILDVPHIALKTRATVIGTESTENVMRAYGVAEEQLITILGEDYQFEGFSLRVDSEHTQSA